MIFVLIQNFELIGSLNQILSSKEVVEASVLIDEEAVT